MRRALASFVLVFVTAGAVHLAQPGPAPQPAPVEMTATGIVEGLLSQDAAVRDRAATELGVMSAETAEKAGAELLRLGVRECQTILACVSAADTANSCIVALAALEYREYEVRATALDVFTRVSPTAAADAMHRAGTPRRIEGLRKLLEGAEYMQGFCDGAAARTAAQGPVQEALRLVVFLDRKLGARGLAMVLRSCADMMLGARPREGEKETQSVAEQAERRRRCAALVFQAIWVKDPAKQFNYIPSTPYEEREKAVVKIRHMLDALETRDVTYREAQRSYKGVRYGDYLFELALEGDATVEARGAAYLRLQWWRGSGAVITGEGYADAIDRINALGRIGTRNLKHELLQWWTDYRARSD